MNALNAASFNAGTVLGAVAGGLVVESTGYEPLGLMMLGGAVVSAGLIALFVDEDELDADRKEMHTASPSSGRGRQTPINRRAG